MAYASLMSGICLAQTGLGAVHGLASPLGAFFPIPHGVVCGTLVASATACNIAALEARDPDNPALPKYAEIGRRFAMQKGLNGPEARRFLVDTLRRWEVRTRAAAPRGLRHRRGRSAAHRRRQPRWQHEDQSARRSATRNSRIFSLPGSEIHANRVARNQRPVRPSSVSVPSSLRHPRLLASPKLPRIKAADRRSIAAARSR
jgi:hypothetical protein